MTARGTGCASFHQSKGPPGQNLERAWAGDHESSLTQSCAKRSELSTGPKLPPGASVIRNCRSGDAPMIPGIQTADQAINSVESSPDLQFRTLRGQETARSAVSMCRTPEPVRRKRISCCFNVRSSICTRCGWPEDRQLPKPAREFPSWHLGAEDWGGKGRRRAFATKPHQFCRPSKSHTPRKEAATA